MGGSSNSRPSTAGAPPQATPIDYNALMRSSTQAAQAAVTQQFRDQIKYYPDMERQQLATMQNLASMLGEGGGSLGNWVQGPAGRRGAPGAWSMQETGQAAPNLFTRDARLATEAALGRRTPIEEEAAKLSGIGGWVTDEARYNYLTSGPTGVESELYRQGAADLALGRALSPEQIRESQQSARSAFASRGLGTSAGSAAAEILNRDAYGSQREAERRNFAGAANDMLTRNVMARRDQAGQQAALGAGMLGQSAGLQAQSANLGMQGASNLIGIDPVRSSMGQGIQMAGGLQTTMGNMITPTYSNAMTTAGNVAGFNANMLDSRYNNYMNNQAALQAARIQAGAAGQAGMMGMIGGIGGGLLSGLGAAIIPSDKRMKTDIKPLGSALKVLDLPVYEYRYKHDKSKKRRVGVMAQDVRKVLPDAVAEFDFKGQKRLAIKPGVIGAALAEELAAQAA